MSRSLVVLAFSLIIGVRPAFACGLDACSIADDLHLENGRFDNIPADEWSWMNHDLALARDALSRGDAERAENIGRWLDHAIDLRLDEMIAGRGERRVKALRRAVRQLIPSEARDPGAWISWVKLRFGEEPGERDGGREEQEAAADRARREMDRGERQNPTPREPEPPRAY